MAVHCAKCGEELLGAVNRCWKCGREFEPQTGNQELPPIRRAPPAESAGPPTTAEVVGVGRIKKSQRLKRGSPFAAPAHSSSQSERGLRPERAPFTARPRRNAAPAVGAALSLVLGAISLLIAFTFPTGGLITAVAGVGTGCWGLYSERRGLATAGLVLSCLALAFAGFNTVVDLYTYVYGFEPWGTISPEDQLM